MPRKFAEFLPAVQDTMQVAGNQRSDAVRSSNVLRGEQHRTDGAEHRKSSKFPRKSNSNVRGKVEAAPRKLLSDQEIRSKAPECKEELRHQVAQRERTHQSAPQRVFVSFCAIFF